MDLNHVAKRSQNVCLEDKVGALFRSMVITDAIVYTSITIISYVAVKTIRKGEKIEYDSIRAAQEAINIMYRQVITWVATVTSPLMPLLTFVVSNCEYARSLLDSSPCMSASTAMRSTVVRV
jgi:hypothetical protein